MGTGITGRQGRRDRALRAGLRIPPDHEPTHVRGNNLEDDTTGQCGFSASNHDLVGLTRS